jgi:peptidylprolyl isomerase
MNMKNIFLVIAILVVVVGMGLWAAVNNTKKEAFSLANNENTKVIPPQNNKPINTLNTNTMTNLEEAKENPIILIETSLGEITIELYIDSTPITAGNFLSLIKQEFYNGVKFHRVIPGFMIQGGDPNTKGEDESIYGTGGPGYSIQDEFAPELSNTEGTISMANAGPNTGGSQFFINTANNTFLDGKHAVFGRVVSGLETVSRIESSETKERDIPIEPVVIKQIIISQE